MHRKRISKAEESDLTRLGIVAKIFARCCQIAYEILRLLKMGFPDAAIARWRSLHENCMTLIIIYKGDDELSKMYLDHAAIEEYKSIEKYAKCYKKLRFRKIDKRRHNKVKAKRDQLLNYYGREFGRDYGWSKNILAAENRNIKGIEEHAGFQHLRAFYDLASDNIHSGGLGQFNRLGHESEVSTESYIGKSFIGFIGPAQLTSYSLFSLIEILTESISSIGNDLTLDMFGSLQRKVVTEFQKCENKVVIRYDF